MILQVIPAVLFFVNEEKVEVREGESGEFEAPESMQKAKGKIQKAPTASNPADLRLCDP